ncbi:MAG: class I SAM-dependent methyltransferase [Polyangiaceae bacterium]
MSEAQRAEPSSEKNSVLTSRLGRPASVLELGCGSGEVGAMARQAGAYVVGVESDLRLVESARRLLDQVLVLDPENSEALEAALAEREFESRALAEQLGARSQPEAAVDRRRPSSRARGQASVRPEESRSLEASVGLCE